MLAPAPTQRETFVGVFVTEDGVDTGEAEFSQRADLDDHLGMAVFCSLARQPSRVVLIDNHPQRRELKAGTMLALALALSRRWRKTIASRRVGVALPPGIGAFAANLGLMFAGKIPVNLNFTAGPTAVSACLRKGEIDTVISAPALRERVPDFPWPERTLDIRAEIDACGKAAIVSWLVAIRLLPARWLARRIGLPDRGGEDEAALLFTSGSAGEPKGVVLTHRNIMANIRQIQSTFLLRDGETMVGCLPVFHSFGFTVTLWYPLLNHMQVATFPSPLETRRLAEIIAAESAEILIGAPTFLRPFLKRAEPAQLRSLRLVVAGAEKMPLDLYEAFLQRFQIPIREGYGLTETSPVLSVNRPEPVPLADGGSLPGERLGSVGLLMPGIRARVVDPDTWEPRPRGEIGVLAVRGANIFGGYLDDPVANAATVHDGWFYTGDLARIDDEGFIYIEGRLSRFSKIGGEMVPHITVEQKIVEAFSLEGFETQPVVVVGVPDETKGESLVALTTEELSTINVRERLSSAGLPNLWIPKRVLKLPQIPTLSTGKLDLRACRRVAEEADRQNGM